MKESWLNEIDIVFILAILHQYGVYCGHFDSDCQCYLLLRVQGFHFHPSIEASVAELDNLFDLEWQQLNSFSLNNPSEFLLTRAESDIFIRLH
jgi:hypothetical protein